MEVPDLAACLTLNKSDVFRTGPRAAAYLAYRKALQEVVSRQLAAWGDSHDATDARPRTQRLERDIERVLDDLADDFPLLNSLIERRAGGQKQLPLPGRGNELARQDPAMQSWGDSSKARSGSMKRIPPTCARSSHARSVITSR